jgi:exodeoxyribonuclease V alpha subunit
LSFAAWRASLPVTMAIDRPVQLSLHSGAAAMPADADGTLSGTVERIVFHNPATGFAVLRVKLADQPEPVTLVGQGPPPAPGVLVRAEGGWQTDPSYGRQFRARLLTVVPPSSQEGMAAYLASGMIKGIGKVMAAKLIRQFGDQVFEVIERQPERLREVPGVGAGLARRIAEAWQDQRAVRDIMLFLHSHGLSALQAGRIFERYGSRAVEVVSANPFRLARDIRGIGFTSADQLALRLAIARDSAHRLSAGLLHVLEEAQAQGHCGLPKALLVERARALLEVDPAPVAAALEQDLAVGHLVEDLVEDTLCVFPPALHQAETEIAAALAALACQRPAWLAEDPAAAMAAVEAQLDLTLGEEQRAALHLALASRLLVITGGPGTGKTTLVRAIVEGLRRAQVEVLLAAPTGRAARRLGERAGAAASTLHRLLEADPGRGFRRDRDRPLAGDLVIVDEVSMVDVPLMHALISALPEDGGLILVGDVDQLPSIGPGQVLADLIGSGRLPVVRLSQIFRQAAESGIVRNAHRINRGEPLELARASDAAGDFYAIRANSPEQGAARVVELVAERIPSRFKVDPIAGVQVLCPVNRGELGTRALNQALQAALNPDAPDRIERFGTTFALGDKVMQIENDYEREVYNGDIGRVVGIDQAEGKLTIEIDERQLDYPFAELDRLVPAYAITVHKAQGSEYPVVVLPLARQHGRMLRRNMVYTAITRARALVVLVVEPGVLETAIEQRPEPRRWSRLRGLLAAPPATEGSPPSCATSI